MVSHRSRVRGPIRYAIPVLLALLLLGAAGRCDGRATVHGLSDDSFMAECTLCTVLPEDLGGTFRLLELRWPGDPQTRWYRLDDVHWVGRRAGRDVLVTGSGSYTTRGRMQRMALELGIDGEPVREFDSGEVPIVGDGPGIDISVSPADGLVGEGPVLHLHSVPFPRDDQTPCGSELQCDARSEICVTTVARPYRYACEPVPAACHGDRSCDCAGEELCQQRGDVCVDAGENVIQCVCRRCR